MVNVVAAPLVSGSDAYHGGTPRRDVFPLIPPGASNVLDLGGGMGATAAAVKAELGAKRAGVVDLVVPDDALSVGCDFAHRADLEDIEGLKRLVQMEGPFDLILCLDILEHLRDPWITVAVLHQALGPGGAIVASLPNIRHKSVVLPLLFGGHWAYKEAGILDRTHLRFFVKETAIALMTGSGLQLEEISSRGIKPGKNSDWYVKASFGLLRPFFEEQYLIRVGRH